MYGLNELNAVEMKRIAKELSGLSILRVVNIQEEPCLAFRDPMGLVDPLHNLLNSEEQGRISRNLEEFGNLAEEKINVASVVNLFNAFPTMIVCKIRDWEEYKYISKLVSLENTDKGKDPTKLVISKWFYEIELAYHTEMEIVISQEDILEEYVAEYRPYVPMALAVFSLADSKGWTLVSCSEFKAVRDLSLSVSLPTGIFYIIPLCGVPYFLENKGLTEEEYLYPLFTESQTGMVPTPKFADTLKEIFRRFDLNKDFSLKYPNLKTILEAFDLMINETEFSEYISKRFDKTKGGLSQKGFQEFMMQNLSTKTIPGINCFISSKENTRKTRL